MIKKKNEIVLGALFEIIKFHEARIAEVQRIISIIQLQQGKGAHHDKKEK